MTDAADDDQAPPEPEKPAAPAAKDEYRRGEKTLLLLIAAIAGLTGILGAAVGGFFSYRAASAESRAADVRAERTERKDAYAQYFTSLDDLNDLVYRIGAEFAEYKPGADQKILGLIDEYDVAWDEWGRLDDAMLLISTAEVEVAARNVTDAENSVSELIDVFRVFMEEGKPDEIQGRMQEFDAGYDALNTLEDVLFEAARKDLADLGYEE